MLQDSQEGQREGNFSKMVTLFSIYTWNLGQIRDVIYDLEALWIKKFTQKEVIACKYDMYPQEIWNYIYCKKQQQGKAQELYLASAS